MNGADINSGKQGGNETELTIFLPTGKDLLKGVAIIWATTFLIGMIIGIVASVIMYFQTHGVEAIPDQPGTSINEQFEPKPVLLLINVLFDTAITFVVCWYFACRKYKVDILKGFTLSRPNKFILIWSMAIGITGSLAAVFLTAKYGTENSQMSRLISSSTTGFIVFVVIAILLPPFEEIYYRSFVFPILQRKFGSFVAVSTVVIWFTTAHIFQIAGDWICLPIIFVMGFIWTIQRYIYKSLLPSIITHWAYNIALVLFVVAGS